MSAKSTIKNASQKLGKVLSPESTSAEDTDILDTLKKEHEEVKALLADLQDAESARERRELVHRIKAALVPHTKAEENDAVIALRDEDAQVDGHEGYLEHEWAAKTLQRLEGEEPESAEHKAAAKVLQDLVEHHIEEEEDNVWGDVKNHFDAAERARMNVKFLAAKEKLLLS